MIVKTFDKVVDTAFSVYHAVEILLYGFGVYGVMQILGLLEAVRIIPIK